MHKTTRSFAGAAPHPRPDASICLPELSDRRDEIQSWLEEAIRLGHVGGAWRGEFPHKVWSRQGEIIYEAVGDSNGNYHGYPLEPDQNVIGLP